MLAACKPLEATMTFAGIQREFAAALLDPERPIPRPVTSHTARTPQKRFAVYRNNVVAGLIGALRARFPATDQIVGAECFAGIARLFVSAHPPRTPVLMHYGDKFPAYLADFPPLADLRYLPDVARLEVARTRAYHAADVAPLDPAALQGIDPETLFGSRLILHPSAEILRSRHPVVTIWAMNSGEASLAPVDEDQAEDALVIRPHFAVAVRKLPVGGATFLLGLQGGLPLGRAAERTQATHPDFDLSANLAGLLSSGALINLIAPEHPKDESP